MTPFTASDKFGINDKMTSNHSSGSWRVGGLAGKAMERSKCRPVFAVGRSLFCVLLLVAFLGSGCTRALAPAPGELGTVRFDLPADPATLDPLFAHVDANSVEGQVARLAFEPFIDIDARGKSIPVLLNRIPTVANGDLSRDGRVITYHLRPGIHWQDGPPVTASDVLFTLRAIVDPRNPVRSREGYDRIVAAERIDDQTVRIRLRAPWAPAVATFFTYGTAPQYVLPEHLLNGRRDLAQDAFGAHPVGNGPFKFVRWERGERLIYEANPGYWRGPPAVERLELHVVPDPGTNLTLLRSDAIDWNLIAPAQQAALAGKTGLAYAIAPLALVAGIAINTAHPPLDDVRVRRALAASIDRAGISRKITYGRYPPIDTAQPLTSWAHDSQARLPAYDPGAADALLDAAGWRRGPNGMRAKDGRPLILTYVQFPETTTGVRVATVVQSELAARGVGIGIKSISNAQLFLPASQGGTLAGGSFDLAYVPWPMGADPDDSFLLACGGPANYMRWCDPVVDALERRAISTPDRAVRTALYARIARRVATAVPIVYLFNPAYVYAYARRLHGFAPNAFLPTWNAASWRIDGR
jgi:peptide/nickel transport system substrate-binding protein